MAHNDLSHFTFPTPCKNPFRHHLGRPTIAPYLINATPFCRECLLERLAEAPAPVLIAARRYPPPPPGACQHFHPSSTPAAIVCDSISRCWDCADAILRDGSPHELAPLKVPELPADKLPYP